MPATISINRAPVLTLWAAVVAQRFGFRWKFGDHLEAARAAMTTLAHAYRPRELASEAFAICEAFRPAILEGVRGWGAKGVLDLRKIRSLAKG